MPDRQKEDWELCLEHLFATPVAARRSEAETSVFDVVKNWHRADLTAPFVTEWTNNRLADACLRVLPKLPGLEIAGRFLAIPLNAPQLGRLFAGSPWADWWAVALKQAPNDIICRGFSCKVCGIARRSLILDLDALTTHQRKG